MKLARATALAAFITLCSAADAQSLLRPPPPAPPTERGVPADHNESLREVSLMMVEAPKPKTYAVHDQVSIIISEASSQTSEQKLDAKKDSALKAAINKFPDLAKFLQLNLVNTNPGEIASVDVSGSSNFKGNGKFERTDKFTDRIEATIIDVKPNGILVLEARKTVGENKEIRTLVLSGSCRREDVTDNNTVLSAQLADLTILSHQEGDVKDTASKGVLTRIVDAIFNF